MLAAPDPRATSLRDLLDRESPYLGSDWMEALEARKRDEAEFHDRDRQDHADETGGSRQENRRFYKVVDKVDAHIKRWIDRTAPGKVFLDYACGHGNQTSIAARAGASLAVGIDISGVSVHNAIDRAERIGLAERMRFLQRDCENTGLPADSFDAVLCSGVLHHMDLNNAYPELHRIVRPGGRILCAEALGHNPLIQWYRDRTPHLRTAWEKDHILRMRDVQLAKRWFEVREVTFFNILSPAAAIAPEVVRGPAIAFADAIDALLTRIPLVQLLSWIFVFELRKPER